MTEAEQAEPKQCRYRLAELLYKEACEEGRPFSSLAKIESTIRAQRQEYMSPTIRIFCAVASGTRTGYRRTLNSLLGQLTLSSEQAKALGERHRHSRILF